MCCHRTVQCTLCRQLQHSVSECAECSVCVSTNCVGCCVCGCRRGQRDADYASCAQGQRKEKCASVVVPPPNERDDAAASLDTHRVHPSRSGDAIHPASFRRCPAAQEPAALPGSWTLTRAWTPAVKLSSGRWVSRRTGSTSMQTSQPVRTGHPAPPCPTTHGERHWSRQTRNK
jgi:hypothetical protein